MRTILNAEFEKYLNRLKHEIKIITKMEYSSYFLSFLTILNGLKKIIYLLDQAEDLELDR